MDEDMQIKCFIVAEPNYYNRQIFGSCRCYKDAMLLADFEPDLISVS